MHWPAVERIWLPAWLRDREAVIARIRETVDEAKQRVLRGEVEPDPARRVPDRPKPFESEPQPITFAKIASAPSYSPQAKRHPMIQVYRPWTPQIFGDVSALDQMSPSMPWASPGVNAAIVTVVEAEGPIQPDRLAKLVASSFGLNRVSTDRRRAIQRMVPAEFRREADECLWPKDMNPETWRVVRRPGEGTSRPIEEVPLVEIGNGMIVVAEQVGGIGADELKREALNLFRGIRITQTIGSRLDAALDRAMAKGLLRRSDNGLIFGGGESN